MNYFHFPDPDDVCQVVVLQTNELGENDQKLDICLTRTPNLNIWNKK